MGQNCSYCLYSWSAASFYSSHRMKRFVVYKTTLRYRPGQMKRLCVTGRTNRDNFQLLYNFHSFELTARTISERNLYSDWTKSESISRRDAQKNGYNYVARPICSIEMSLSITKTQRKCVFKKPSWFCSDRLKSLRYGVLFFLLN